MEAITDIGFTPLFSDSSSFPVPFDFHSHDICLEAIKQTDIVVLVLQERYGQKYMGTRAEYNGISITHAEYREAVKLGKKIIVLTEKTIPIQRHWYKKDSSDKRVTISTNVFDFYYEVSASLKDNWINPFDDSIDCRNQLRNRLNTIRNLNLSQNNLELRNKILSIPSAHIIPGTLDVLSYWKILCDSWSTVNKIWKISIFNTGDKPFDIKSSLTLPIRYNDAKLVNHAYTLNDGIHTLQIDNISTQIKIVGDPIHGKALIITPLSTITILPKSIFTAEINFTHADYFKELSPDQRVNSGVINYLDYPEFHGRSIVQRVCKEYYISKQLTNMGNRTLAIYPSPLCDWSSEDYKYWIFGYAKLFEIQEQLKIEILIKP
jgi:hypothetical protein